MSEHSLDSLASLLAWFWCSHAVTLCLSVVHACGVGQVVLQLGTVERAASLYFELQDLIRQAHTNILADKPPQPVRHRTVSGYPSILLGQTVQCR